MSKIDWSDKDEYIRQFYGETPKRELAKFLGVTPPALYHRAIHLGLATVHKDHKEDSNLEEENRGSKGNNTARKNTQNPTRELTPREIQAILEKALKEGKTFESLSIYLPKDYVKYLEKEGKRLFFNGIKDRIKDIIQCTLVVLGLLLAFGGGGWLLGQVFKYIVDIILAPWYIVHYMNK